jgi:hypothetical protein
MPSWSQVGIASTLHQDLAAFFFSCPEKKAAKLRNVPALLQAFARLVALKRLGVLLFVLAATLCAANTASALEPAQTKTRVWGFDFAEHNSDGLLRVATSGKHQGNRLALSEVASGSLLAAEGAEAAATAERAGVLENVLTSEGTLNTSQTVARQLAGQRGFIPSQSILDTIASGARVADPQGVAGQFMYRAGASFNGSEGTLEVLVDEASGQINHVLFRSGVSP